MDFFYSPLVSIHVKTSLPKFSKKLFDREL